MRRQAGFTLIEMVVALTLFSLTSLLALQALGFASRLWTSETRERLATEEVGRARALLRDLVESTYPQDPLADPSARIPSLLSDGHTLELSAPAPHFIGQGGLARWWVNTQSNDHGEDDLRIAWSFDRHRPPANDARSEILLADVEKVTWTFLINDAVGVGHWVDRWQAGAPLPLLVRLDVQFPDRDPRVWHTLMLAPRLSSSQGCQFDLVSRRCRGET